MKIICIGRNYVNHAKELNNKIPKQPLVFIKPETAINNSNELIYPSFTNDLHYELELVLKISKTGSQISLDEADDYYNEIGLGIDFTARDVQAECKKKGHPWEKAKAFDNAASVGEFRSKMNVVKSQQGLLFSLLKNDELVQNGNSNDMIFEFNYLVHYTSQYFKLEKGDLIFTGTPEGVGPVEKGDKLVGLLGKEILLEVLIN